MRIAVTGPRGRLGSELVRRGCMPIEASILDWHDLRTEIDALDPDVVINCAAYTDVDACENAPRKAAEVNTCGVYILAQTFAGKLIHISTDYIFDGANGPYTEQDTPNPISIYGWSKLGGELVLRDRPETLIVRTTVLFDQFSYNFVTSVIRRLLSGKTVTAPDLLYGSPTYVPHLAEAILQAVDLTGVINITGNRIMSRLQFARAIAKALGHGVTRIFDGPITGHAPRPLNAGLDAGKAQLLGIPIYDPLEGVKEVINALETMVAG